MASAPAFTLYLLIALLLLRLILRRQAPALVAWAVLGILINARVISTGNIPLGLAYLAVFVSAWTLLIARVGIVAMMAMLIFLGIFVDQVSMMMITLPIFMPIVQTLGVDPIWFGVMFLICMQLGLLLPPHGLLLMTMRGVAPAEVTMAHIFRAVVPYVVMSLLLLAAVFWFPPIATWLPRLIG